MYVCIYIYIYIYIYQKVASYRSVGLLSAELREAAAARERNIAVVGLNDTADREGPGLLEFHDLQGQNQGMSVLCMRVRSYICTRVCVCMYVWV